MAVQPPQAFRLYDALPELRSEPRTKLETGDEEAGNSAARSRRHPRRVAVQKRGSDTGRRLVRNSSRAPFCGKASFMFEPVAAANNRLHTGHIEPSVSSSARPSSA